MKHVVAFIGLSHDHAWTHLSSLQHEAGVESVRVFETDTDVLGGLAPGQVSVCDSIDEVLDGATCAIACGSTRGHLAAVEACVRSSVPLMLEKPLAVDASAGDAIVEAADAAGLPVMVNWPLAWVPALRHALQLVRNGLIGSVVRLNVRLGNSGPEAFGCSDAFVRWLRDPTEAGEGAYTDYAGYAVLLAERALGMPLRVHATLSTTDESRGSTTDAVLVLEHQHGVSVLEVGWSYVGAIPDDVLVVRGTAGSVAVRLPFVPREGAEPVGDARLVHRDATNPLGRTLDIPDLPPDFRSAVGHFIDRLSSGRRFDRWVDLRTAQRISHVMGAGLRSHEQGCSVAVEPGSR